MTAAKPEMNTTPLIDVLLVLLVLLVLTLPRSTHRVSFDLPSGQAAAQAVRPIRVEIEFDGRVVWGGRPVETDRELQSLLEAVARDPQAPPIQLIPDRHGRYERVVQVLAAAQRAHVARIGLTPVSEL